MASEVISIESWKRENPDWMARQREDRPYEFRLKGTGDEALDERRYAIMDELWTWPKAFRERIAIFVRLELSPVDEEHEAELRRDDEGLESFERTRQPGYAVDPESLAKTARKILAKIQQTGHALHEARRLRKADSIINRRDHEATGWKDGLLVWMFRHGIRDLAELDLRGARRREIEREIAQLERRLLWLLNDAEKIETRLRNGITTKGPNKGKPLSVVRIGALTAEREAGLRRADEARAEIEALRKKLAVR